jgi:thiol-disulfide isomerase/thioredoxin
MRARALLAGLAAAVTLAVAGCGAAGPAPASVPVAAAGAVAKTLQFTGTTLDGKPFDAATLAGRPTVLWFWAPWCATCASEAWTVSDAVETYADRLAILGVAGMGDNAAMHSFVTDLKVDAVTSLDDGAGEIWRRFQITEQSSYVLLDRRGTVVHTGYLDDPSFKRAVAELVG